jgi:hypothetical protein
MKKHQNHFLMMVYLNTNEQLIKKMKQQKIIKKK